MCLIAFNLIGTPIQTTIQIFHQIGKLDRFIVLVRPPALAFLDVTHLWSNRLVEGTANLIIHMLAVDRKWVHPLPIDKPTVIPNTGGVTVTPIEANHCLSLSSSCILEDPKLTWLGLGPGSSLFLFEGKQTVNAGDSTFKSPFVGSSKMFRYLHCGDFRASPQHVLHPAIKGMHLDIVYLDTTYLNPKVRFLLGSLFVSRYAC